MSLSDSNQRSILKILSLFSLVRGYNIIVLVLAQYLTARYILAPQTAWITLVLDFKFFAQVFSFVVELFDTN